jgi:hypothetical protein
VIDTNETHFVGLVQFQSHIIKLLGVGAHAPTAAHQSSVLHLAVRLPCEKKSKWLLNLLATVSADFVPDWDVADDGLTPAELALQLKKDDVHNLIMHLQHLDAMQD